MTVGQIMAKLGVDPKEYEKGLRNAEAQANKAGLRIGSIFKNAFSVTTGMAMFEALKRGFKATVETAIDFNSMLQTAQIGFATMLGSAEMAQKFLDDMADFAIRTPFEFPELLEAAKRMLAYGFAAGEVLPTLRAVGDAAAALGSGGEGIDRITLALGQIRAKGKLSAEEMRQLTEAGVPAWHILADAMGKTVPELQKMVSKGLIPGYKAVEMLTAGMTQRFGGMMAAMENTWQGVTSSIKDIWRMTIGTITSNLFKGLNTWLQGVRDFATNFYSAVKQLGLQTAISMYFGGDVAALVNILGTAIHWLASIVSGTAKLLIQYGQVVRFVATTILTYITLTKIASMTTAAFRLISLALKGELTTHIPVLSWVSTAVGIYRVQLALASKQGIVLTGVLAKLKLALWSLWAALGPIGWVVLGISAAVAGGMALWNKYTKSVNAANEAAMNEKIRLQQEELQRSLTGITDAAKNQADAFGETGKAAKKAAGQNIQSFDEVHQLQEDITKNADDMTSELSGADLGVNIPGIDMGGIGIPDIGASIEEMKPTLSGFWEWIKQGAGNLWEGVKEKWNGFTSWISSWGIWTTLKEKWNGFKEGAGNLWEGVKEKWNGFTGWVSSWGIWTTLKEKWNGFKEGAGNLWEGVKEKWNGFTGWVSSWGIWTTLKEKWSGFKEGAANLWEGVKEKWSGFKEWAGDLWEGAKTKWGNFTGWVQEKWSNFRTKAGEIWEGVKTNVQEKWNALKTDAPTTWENIKTNIQTKWENLKTKAGETWGNIKTSIQEKWNALKTDAPTTWENIKTNIQTKWENLKTKAGETWGNIKTSIQEKWNALKTDAPTTWENIKTTISDKWNNLKTNAPTTWGSIKTSISEKWNALKTDAPTVWGNIRKEIFDRWDALKTDAPTTWENIRKTISDKWNELKNNAPSTWEELKNTISNKWNEIKDDAFTWGKNLIQNFVDGIKEKVNTLKESLKNVGQRIKNFLGFSSPTKEGPGSDADKWAPNFMDMFRSGIAQGIPGIRTSVNAVADEISTLSSMTVQPTIHAAAGTADSGIMSDSIAQAVYRAIIDAFRITQASSGQSGNDDKELVLKIDNTVLARMQLPAIIREGQRQGINLVVQGV